MSNLNYLQKLSNKQLDAIKLNGNVLLTAIPGSGKTRTLTNKVLYEYDENEFKKIIAITYTNRASEEMEERIIKQMGEVPKNIWIGTIHKFCLEFILRKYSSFSSFLSKPFCILGEEDDIKLIKELKEKYNISMYDSIDYSLSENGLPNEIKNYDFVYEYYEIQRKSRKINFNLILYESYLLLKNNNNVTLNLSSMIKYLCVDEYQDTQELQYQILSLIYKSTKGFNMFFVGDPNQAIYTGLGGVVKNKNELELTFDTYFNELELNECYRSNQEIIDFYSNFSLKKVDMISCNTNFNNPLIYINHLINKNNLIDEIANIIKKNLDKGILENEICIIAPQWTFLLDISTKLRMKLPELKFDAPNIIPLKRDEENICYKLSKLILVKYSFYNKNRVFKIMKDIKQQLFDEYSLSIEYSEYELLKLLFSSETQDDIGTEYIKNTLINFFHKLNLLNIFKEDIIAYVDKTVEKIHLYQDYGIEDNRLSFEKSLRSKEGIVVSTIHGIKGDEFRIVIAFGLLRGYVPHWNSIMGTYTEVEDSNKLLFVLCSRAREKIYLFAEKGRKTKGGKNYEMNSELNKAMLYLNSKNNL